MRVNQQLRSIMATSFAGLLLIVVLTVWPPLTISYISIHATPTTSTSIIAFTKLISNLRKKDA